MACAIEPSATFEEQVSALIEESKQLIKHYNEIEAEQYANPASLDKSARLERLTLRRNLFMREAWVSWAEEVQAELKSMS